MIKLLIYPQILLGCLLAPAVFAQEVSPSFVHVSATASVFQVIDDVRAENEDADLAYIRKAVARNEAAIEAAKAILKTSFDADVRMMAGDSLKLHDTELRVLKAWLVKHGPQEVPTPVASLPAPVVVAPAPAVVKPMVKPVVKPAVQITPTVPVSASVPPVQPKPLPASTEVTITTPRILSATQPPLPGEHISMNPMEEPTMQLLDIPPVPVSLTPVTP